MKVPGLYKEEFISQPNPPIYHPVHQQQPSTKKVWRLKKYSKTDDEIKQEQKKYEDMEFTPKKASSRRPRIKPGSGNQEFVFVDLSPRKKDETKESPVNSTAKSSPKKQGNRVSRLFRLTSSQETLKPAPHSSQLLSSPDIKSSASSFSLSSLQQPDFNTSPQQSQPHTIAQQAPPLKRSYTTLAISRFDQQQQRERSNSSASLVMTISDSGRAVLQPQQPLSASSSTSDLFSLTRNHSSRQTYYSRSPIPSPKRMESPVPQDRFPHHHPLVLSLESIPKYDLDPESYNTSSDDDDTADAFKAFSKVVKKTSVRKRANTLSSMNSNSSSLISPVVQSTAPTSASSSIPTSASAKNLTRNHSISSISSIYTKTARISPSRANLLRQATTPIPTLSSTSDLTPSSQHSNPASSFIFGDGSASHSYFEDVSKTPNPRSFHSKQSSISILGPPLQLPSEPESMESPLDDYNDGSEVVVFPHDTVELKDMDTTLTEGNNDGNNTLSFDTDDFFDFSAFSGNYENHNHGY